MLKLKIIKKAFGIILITLLIFSTYSPYLALPFSPQKAEAATNICRAGDASTQQSVYTTYNARVGGVSLDQAAKFLADMSDITGAYYDANLDRIVFIGRNNTSLPKFQKDDLAVAIKSVIFNNTIPGVSMVYGTPNDNLMDVVYSGKIENTNFGKTLIDTDYKLKIYMNGYDQNNTKITSSVSGYQSFLDRIVAKGTIHRTDNSSRFWITQKDNILKKDDATKSFVFDTSTMQVKTEPLNPNNETGWNDAANEFSQQMTAHYDEYAQETPLLLQTKQLGKIVSVIKWIKDNQISTDFNWARDYTPKFVTTPNQLPQLTTPTQPGGYFLTGGVDYATSNTYSADNGTAAGLKSSSQAVSTAKEDTHWTFTNGGQAYDAVAVTASAFRSPGSYNTSAADMSFPSASDTTFAFQRTYSSYSGGQYGLGNGWNIFPAALYNNKPTAASFTCTNGSYIKSLSFVSQTGAFESFTINDCNIGYVPDDSAYHSKVIRNTDGTYTVTPKDQTKYKFDTNLRLVQIIDKNNNTVSYNYDGAGRLSNINDGKGHQITLNYGSNNLVSSISDWASRSVTYTYDANGNLITAKDANNNITTYAYDTNNELTSVTNRNNQLVLTNTYTDDAKLLTQKDASNVISTYSYDKVNKIITLSDNQVPSRVQTTKYDSKGRVLEQKDPLNFTVQYTYGIELAPLTIKDKNNKVATNTYDANGNLTSTTYPDTKKVTYQYDTNNRLAKITDERYSVPGKDTTNTYDTSGNLTQVNEAGQITKYTYDANGNILTSTDQLNNVTTWTRDSFGNKLTEKDPSLKTTTFEYDTIGRLKKKTDADSKVFSYTYDNNGNILTQIDSVGTTTYVYDKENKLAKVIKPDTTANEFIYNSSNSLTDTKDPALNTSQYGYDVYQNLVSQTDALNKITNYTYDALNRQTQSTSPLSKIYKWEYDANGNITKRTDANNSVTTYQYDALNRLTKITYPNTNTATYEYDARGNRTKMIDSVGTSIYTYDNFDRLMSSTNAYGKVLSYTYDSANNLKTITYPDKGTVTYGYDLNNRLNSVKDWDNKITTYTYNNNGTLATRTLPNTIKTTYTYDGANRVTSIAHTKTTTTLAKYDYTRDTVGNIKVATESGTFIGTAQTIKYDYDVLGRITKASYPSNKNFEYTYDKMGNRLTQKVDGSTTTYQYDNDYRLTQKDALTNFTYDNNGNQTKKPSGNFNPDPTFIYDYENRLTRHVTSAQNIYNYLYDGLGNRLRQEMSTAVERYVYDTSGSIPRLMAISGDQNFAHTFWIYGLGLIYDEDGSYYLEDGSGNIRFTTGSSGGKNSSQNFDPFGNIRSGSGIADRFQFNGQEFDEGSSLYFLKARYYDPDLGRFISKDPIKGTLRNPMSLNPYQYAYNNPIINSDPSGLDAILYTDPMASVPILGGHTGLYYQDGQGTWYQSDLAIDSTKVNDIRDVLNGQGKYNVQKLPKDFSPSSVSKVMGVINNPFTQYYKTTREQDVKIASYITGTANKINSGESNYMLLQNNCKQNSYDALQTAGVFAPDTNLQPSPMIRWFFYNQFGF